MSLQDLVATATNKNNFLTLADYIRFCQRYLDFIAVGLQAVIVAQNETNYRFFQYREDGYFNITRPINASLMYDARTVAVINNDFLTVLRHSTKVPTTKDVNRAIIRKAIYTI